MSTKWDLPGGKVKRGHESCLQNLMTTSKSCLDISAWVTVIPTDWLTIKSLNSLCPPAADGKLLWDNPSQVGTYDASCDCYRGSSWGWRNFVKHFDLRRRNYLKNDDLIIFVDFEGQWCSISVWIRCGFIRKTSILSQCFKAARCHS